MRHRLIATVAVPVVVGTLVLTGCGSTKKSTTNTSSSSGSKPTYTIAYQGPLSGGNAQLGLNMAYAVQLAVNQANAKGDLPFKLKFAKQDDQGSPDQSPTAAQKSIQDPKVMVVIGPAFSGATNAAEPLFSQADLASVTPSATRPDLTTHGWHNFFRAVADDNAQGPAAATYLAKVVKAKTVYSIDDASDYAKGLSGALDSALKADGVTVIHETAPASTQCQGTGNSQQYGAIAGKVQNKRPDAVYYSGYYCDFALLAKALRSAGYKGQLMSDDGSNDNKYVEQASASVAEGTLLSCACTDLASDPNAASFVSQFKSLAGFPVGTYSGEAYDAANAAIAAMKSVGKNLTRAKVVQAIANVDYQGLTKEIKFSSDGNVATRTVYVYQVKNGKITFVGDAAKLAGG